MSPMLASFSALSCAEANGAMTTTPVLIVTALMKNAVAGVTPPALAVTPIATALPPISANAIVRLRLFVLRPS